MSVFIYVMGWGLGCWVGWMARGWRDDRTPEEVAAEAPFPRCRPALLHAAPCGPGKEEGVCACGCSGFDDYWCMSRWTRESHGDHQG